MCVCVCVRVCVWPLAKEGEGGFPLNLSRSLSFFLSVSFRRLTSEGPCNTYIFFLAFSTLHLDIFPRIPPSASSTPSGDGLDSISNVLRRVEQPGAGSRCAALDCPCETLMEGSVSFGVFSLRPLPFSFPCLLSPHFPRFPLQMAEIHRHLAPLLFPFSTYYSVRACLGNSRF